MKQGKSVRGVRRTVENLNKLTNETYTGFQTALITFGARVQASAQKNAPVDLGNLQASAFTVWGRNSMPTAAFSGSDSDMLRKTFNAAVSEAAMLAERGKAEYKFRVVVGFGAHYAVYVHEGSFAMKGRRGPKYLERAYQEFYGDIVKAIETEAKKQVRKHKMPRGAK